MADAVTINVYGNTAQTSQGAKAEPDEVRFMRAMAEAARAPKAPPPPLGARIGESISGEFKDAFAEPLGPSLEFMRPVDELPAYMWPVTLPANVFYRGFVPLADAGLRTVRGSYNSAVDVAVETSRSLDWQISAMERYLELEGTPKDVAEDFRWLFSRPDAMKRDLQGMPEAFLGSARPPRSVPRLPAEARQAQRLAASEPFLARAPSRDELLDRVFAVHATERLPLDGVVEPRRLTEFVDRASHGDGPPPSFRPTIHFALGELADFNDAVASLESWLASAERKLEALKSRPEIGKLHRRAFDTMPPNEVREFFATTGIEAPDDFWPAYAMRRPLVSPFAPITAEDLLRDAFANTHKSIDLFERLLEELTEQRPDLMRRTLALLREPAVRDYLRRYENIDLPDGQPATLRDLIAAHPVASQSLKPMPYEIALVRRLFGQSTTHASFDSMREALSEAEHLRDDLSRDAREIMTRPLAAIRQRDSFAPGERLGIYEQMRRTDDLAKHFDNLGLGRQFREAYPNPSDLWREERPLIEVIRELERR
jgi:hypothetical protein